MPVSCYYLNVQNGANFIVGEEALEFDSLAAAEHAAVEAAVEIG
jgi:hypothetical protein